MIKDSFAEQIKSIPAFNSLHKGYQDNFNQGNFYMQRFMPPEKVVVCSESGRCKVISLNEDEKLALAQEALLNDNSGYFAEFVHDDAIREDVTEVIRFIFREFHQC